MAITRADLFKQRRLFVGLSLLLTAIYAADIEIQKAVTVSGLSLTVNRPGWILAGLWAAYVWAAWRYYQYHRDFAGPDAQSGRDLTIRAAWRVAAQRSLERATRSGELKTYEIAPDDAIHVTIPATTGLDLDGQRGGYLRVVNVQRRDPTSGLPTGPVFPRTLTFDAAEVAEMEAEAARAFHLRFPYSADYLAPYYFGALPFAGLALYAARKVCGG